MNDKQYYFFYQHNSVAKKRYPAKSTSDPLARSYEGRKPLGIRAQDVHEITEEEFFNMTLDELAEKYPHA